MMPDNILTSAELDVIEQRVKIAALPVTEYCTQCSDELLYHEDGICSNCNNESEVLTAEDLEAIEGVWRDRPIFNRDDLYQMGQKHVLLLIATVRERDRELEAERMRRWASEVQYKVLQEDAGKLASEYATYRATAEETASAYMHATAKLAQYELGKSHPEDSHA